MSPISHYLEQIRKNTDMVHLEPVIMKELFYQDILAHMNRNRYFDQLTFIGGTAIRLCYGGERLSEDLDFTGGKDFSVNRLETFSSDIKIVLEKKYGVPVEVAPPKQDRTNTRTWKIQIITDPEHPHIPTQRIHVDIVCIDSYHRQLLTIQNRYQIPSPVENMLIPVESASEIFTDKVIALAFRGGAKNPIKGRDLFDIHVFHTQGISEVVPEFQKKLADHGRTIPEFHDRINQKIERMKSDPGVKKLFEQEMQRFLPLSLYEKTVAQSGFYEYLINLVDGQARKLRVQRTKDFGYGL